MIPDSGSPGSARTLVNMNAHPTPPAPEGPADAGHSGDDAQAGHGAQTDRGAQTDHDSQSQQTGFFPWLRGLGVTRGEDRWFAGVCSGIAHRFGIDPLIVRGIAVALFFVGGIGVLTYLAAWLLLPAADGRIHLEEALQGRASTGVWVGLGAVVLLLLTPIGGHGFGIGWFWDDDVLHLSGLAIALRVIWTIAVTAALIWLVVWLIRRASRSGGGPQPTAYDDAAQQTRDAFSDAAQQSKAAFAAANAQGRAQARAAHEEARARGRQQAEQARMQGQAAAERARLSYERSRPGSAAVSIGFGIALVVGGAVGGLAPMISSEVSALTAVALGFAAALLVLGVTITVLGLMGRRGGVLSFLAVVAAAGTLTLSPLTVVRTGPITVAGDAHWSVQPSDLVDEASAPSFSMVASTGRLDLGALDDASHTPAPIDVSSTAGTLSLMIPDSGTFRIVTTATVSTLNQDALPGGEPEQRSGLGFSSITVVRDGRVVSGDTDDSAGVTVNAHLIASTMSLQPAR